MRFHVILPRVEPSVFKMPSVRPHKGCRGKHFVHHQAVVKPAKDTEHDAVGAHRYGCLRCGQTLQVYPQRLTRAQTSQRVKGLRVFLCLLGLSYGAVFSALEALGHWLQVRQSDELSSLSDVLPNWSYKLIVHSFLQAILRRRPARRTLPSSHA